MSKTTLFLAKIKPYAVAACRGTQVPPGVIMAQAVIEADHGDEPVYLRGNNPFGVKANASWTGPTVTVAADGQAAVKFRAYKDLTEAFREQVELLTCPYYAYAARWLPTDPWRFLFELQRGPQGKGAGYCTNKRYADEIMEIMEDFQLMTDYELEKARAKQRVQKAGIVQPATPDAWVKPATKEEVAVLICRTTDYLAKGGKL